MATTQKYKQINSNARSGKRYVISDIHGCAKSFKALVNEKLKLTPNDQLFLLGDYINRGPDSAGVLEFILSMTEQQFQVYPLRGNHEEMLLNTWKEYMQAKKIGAYISFATRIHSPALLNELGELPVKYVQLLESLPYYYELDHFYLVHAGFNFDRAKPLEDYQNMVWIRRFQKNLTQKIIVHGHQITRLTEIRRKIEQKSTIIPLDNGCYYGLSNREVQGYRMGDDVGHLCGLALDSMELFVQENID
jgi:serine/threonine protein phosphatase 1